MVIVQLLQLTRRVQVVLQGRQSGRHYRLVDGSHHQSQGYDREDNKPPGLGLTLRVVRGSGRINVLFC